MIKGFTDIMNQSHGSLSYILLEGGDQKKFHINKRKQKTRNNNRKSKKGGGKTLLKGGQGISIIMNGKKGVCSSESITSFPFFLYKTLCEKTGKGYRRKIMTRR